VHGVRCIRRWSASWDGPSRHPPSRSRAVPAGGRLGGAKRARHPPERPVRGPRFPASTDPAVFTAQKTLVEVRCASPCQAGLGLPSPSACLPTRTPPGSLPSDCRDLQHRARLALAQARARAPPRGAHSHSLATHSLASRARAAAQQARARAWTTDSRTASSSDLSTSDGSVSSSSTLGPWRSGPNAQIERAASRSQSYFCCAARAHSARLRPGRFCHVAFVTCWPGAQHGCRAALGRWA